MQGENICNDLYYARGKYMQKPIICKGKIYAKDLYYARAKYMQKPKICKDL